MSTEAPTENAPFEMDLPLPVPTNDVPATASSAAQPEKKKRKKDRVELPFSSNRGSNDDPRPFIRLALGELFVEVRQTIHALCADDNLYHRDCELVHVARATAPADSDEPTIASDADIDDARKKYKHRVPPGTPQIRHIATATLRERLTRYARFEKWDRRAEDFVRTNPTSELVNAIHTRGEWPGLPKLRGIIEAPTLRPDGTLIDKEGYDKQTELLYIPNANFPPINPKPTLQDAQRALAELLDVFVDFPCGDADRSVAIAALLTILARAAIAGPTPAFFFDANAPGSGKSLMAYAIVAIVTGRAGGHFTYPEEDEELEKILSALALQGAPWINFDNVTHKFGGGPLDRCLTSMDEVSLRVLGKSELRTLPWRAVVLGSGNNVEIAGDTYRRILKARIETPYEQAEDRPIGTFKHPERIGRLVPWVLEQRSRLVSAALTLLLAYIQSGSTASRKMASFEEWSALIPAAIVWAGGADPLERRINVQGIENQGKQSVAIILREWARLDPSCNGMTTRALIELLYPAERMRGEAAPDGYGEMREAIEELVTTKPGQKPDPNKLGYKLRALRDRNFGGFSFATSGQSGGTTRWIVKRAQTENQ